MEQDVVYSEEEIGDSKQINIVINIRNICSKCKEQKEKEQVITVAQEEARSVVDNSSQSESARKKWQKREERALKDALVKPEELVKHKKSILPNFLSRIKRKSWTQVFEEPVEKHQTFKAPDPPGLKSALRSRSPSPTRKQVNFDLDTAAVKECIQLSNKLEVHEEEKREEHSDGEEPLISVESLVPQLLEHPVPEDLLTALCMHVQKKYHLQCGKQHEKLEPHSGRPLFKKSKLLPIFRAAATGLKLALVTAPLL